eukprot:NODE_160_length_15021_cov_0.894786.p3 type:complete len:549 gc:universal NODE_160_length_15021_cov_0.894786:14179-12533(-)
MTNSKVEDLQQLLQQAKNLNSYTTNISSIYSLSKKLSSQAPPATKQLDHLNYYQNSFHKRKATNLDKTQEFEQNAVLNAFNISNLKYEQHIVQELDEVYQDIIKNIKENCMAIMPKQSMLELKIQGENKFKSTVMEHWADVGQARLWKMVNFIYKESSPQNVIVKAKTYLESEFRDIMQKVVERHSAISKIGNNFNQEELIDGFMRVKNLEGTSSQKLYFSLRTGLPVDLKRLNLGDDVYSLALKKCRGDILAPREQLELDRVIHNTWEHMFWHLLHLFTTGAKSLEDIKKELDLSKGSPHDKAQKCFSVMEYGQGLNYLLQDSKYALDAIHIAILLHQNQKLLVPTSPILSDTLFDQYNRTFHIQNLIISYILNLSELKDKVFYLMQLINGKGIFLKFVQSQWTDLLVHANKNDLDYLLQKGLVEYLPKMNLSEVEFKESIVSSAATQALAQKKIETALYLWDYSQNYEAVLHRLNESLTRIIQGIPLYTFQKNDLIKLTEKYVKQYSQSTDLKITMRLLDLVYFKDALVEQQFLKAVEVFVANLVY